MTRQPAPPTETRPAATLEALPPEAAERLRARLQPAAPPLAAPAPLSPRMRGWCWRWNGASWGSRGTGC